MPTGFAFTPIPPSRAELRRPATVSELVGNWRGELRDANGGRESFTLLRDASSDAAVAGRFLFFATREVSPTGVRLLEASNNSFVAMAGPYYCPRQNDDVVTVFEGARHGDEIDGTYYTRSQKHHDTVRSGEFLARRAGSAHRAA